MTELEDQIREIVGVESENHKLVMQTLRDFARSLQRAMGDPFLARFEPGFLIQNGLQFSLQVKSDYAEDKLFKIYVPAEGFPVRSRLHGLATNIEELNDMLYEMLESQRLRLRSVMILGSHGD